MPKKTKKQKIRAEKRHSAPGSTSPAAHPAAHPAGNFVFQYQSRVKDEKQNTDSTDELKSVRSDIAKTIALACLALVTEYLIYLKFFASA